MYKIDKKEIYDKFIDEGYVQKKVNYNKKKNLSMESLILAQDERWRHA